MAATKTLPLDYEMAVYNGTTFHREFRWLPDGTTAMDFTGWTGSMIIGAPQSRTALLTLDSDNGGVLLSSGGQIVLIMTPAQTAALPTGVLSYSLDLTAEDGTITRFLRGRLSVVTDAGRSS